MSNNEHIDFETRTVKNPVGVGEEALGYALVFKTRIDRDNFVQRSQAVPKAVNLTIKVPEELVVALEDANQMCRSMYQIAARGGKDTNWTALTTRVSRELDRQEATLKMLRDDGQLKDATQPTDVPCRTCNSDPESCADVPSLRHCEAANRETATQPPQVTDEQRQAALKDFEVADSVNKSNRYEVRDDSFWQFDSKTDQYIIAMGLFACKHANLIKSALQSPAVPRGLTALMHDADSAVRHAQGFINMSGQKDLNEIQNATAWLNTAKENCIKALALLGGKEG